MKKALVFDDQPLIFEVIQAILEEFHIETFYASSLEEAQGQLQQENFDLLIVDLNIPGTPLSDMLTTHIPYFQTLPLKLVMISAHTYDPLTMHAFPPHCYLEKPFHLEDFIKTLNFLDVL
jgi:DNA-binding response OmpR family regulator